MSPTIHKIVILNLHRISISLLEKRTKQQTFVNKIKKNMKKETPLALTFKSFDENSTLARMYSLI